MPSELSSLLVDAYKGIVPKNKKLISFSSLKRGSVYPVLKLSTPLIFMLFVLIKICKKIRLLILRFKIFISSISLRKVGVLKLRTKFSVDKLIMDWLLNATCA